MSGATFSDDWLALREAADRRARNAALERRLADALAGLSEQRIVDLGAGTGANLRALAPRLGRRQHWTLLDHDGALARIARARLAAFADTAREDGAALELTLGDRAIRVSFAQADLARDPAAPFASAPHLVTASAFHDLVSTGWCAAFAAAARGSGAAIHSALTCDGRDAWLPPHPADAAVAAAFRAHQSSDKGFGPAAGADGAGVLAQALAAQGYRLETADSPWRLGPADGALIARLAAGTAEAAAHIMDPPTARDWGRSRAGATACTIGHLDLLALPPE